jgi:hypothetical protein
MDPEPYQNPHWNQCVSTTPACPFFSFSLNPPPPPESDMKVLFFSWYLSPAQLSTQADGKDEMEPNETEL